MINPSRIVADFFFFGQAYLRNRIGLFFAIIFPVMLIVIFGAIFLGGSSGPTTLYVQNLDTGPVSGPFITALKNTAYSHQYHRERFYISCPPFFLRRPFHTSGFLHRFFDRKEHEGNCFWKPDHIIQRGGERRH